jgi:D-xylose transport system substrate-binding protein
MRVLRTKSGRKALWRACVLVVVGLLGVLGSACASAGASATTAGTANAAARSGVAATTRTGSDCSVGVAWHNFAEERLAQFYQPQIEKAVEAVGGTYLEEDAKSSAVWQAHNIDKLRDQGANVIVLIPALVDQPEWPETLQAVQRTADAGIPVIAFESFLDNPKVLNIGFDQVEIGRQEARAGLAKKASGNYVILKGHPGNAEADWIAAGIHDVLKPAVDSGSIKIVAEQAVENWDPSIAQGDMAGILAKTPTIDAVIAESDGLAGGANDAIAEFNHKLQGEVFLAGKDADFGGLNRVARGFQTVTVWSDLRQLGAAVGQAAVALCQKRDINAVAGVKPLTWPKGDQTPSILLAPQTIDRDNLKVVLDAGWTSKELLCRDVYVDIPPACQ